MAQQGKDWVVVDMVYKSVGPVPDQGARGVSDDLFQLAIQFPSWILNTFVERQL